MDIEYETSRSSFKPEGRYANYFKVGHNAFEFLIECSQFYPQNEKEHLHTRIITGPAYAKALLETLRESIERYEQTFGAIIEDEEEAEHVE
jgi:hypothetical protein